MPRFPIVPQRTRVPAAFSNSPRAEAADFGGGLGEAVAEFGAEAAGLAQVIKKRQELAERQAAREAKRASDEAEAETLADEAAEPEAAGNIERRQQSFEKKAEVLRQNYKDHPLEPQVNAQLELQGQAWTRKQVSGEAGRRAKADLARADEISGRWLERVTQDPAQFDEAAANLLGEDGPVKGLGLRPEVQAAWESQAFEALLTAQMQGDPQRLISELEAGRWSERLSDEQQANWLEDARDAASLRDRKQSLERRQRIAGEVLALQRSIAHGEAGLAQIRRAEREGRFSPEQIEGLKRDAKQAEIRAQILQAAQDEYEIALISGIGFDAESEAHRQTAEDFYVATFRKAVRSGADEATQERLADAVARTGYVTKGLAQDLTAALSSEDPNRRVAGAQLYGRLLVAAPDLLPPSLDPEVRALGGVLNRWLDAGLPPEEALRRTEAELPVDGTVAFLDEEETASLQRDLGSLFYSEDPARHVTSILDLLERNYLADLGQGLTPRQARMKLRRDAGRVIAKLIHARSLLESEPTWIEGSSKKTEAEGGLFHLAQAAIAPTQPPPIYGQSQVDQDLNAAAARELQRLGGDLSDEAGDLGYELNKAINLQRARLFPAYAAFVFGHAAMSIGDGKILLGHILEKDAHNDSRLVEIMHPEHGRMVIREERENPNETFRGVEISFTEPGTWEWVTERLPNFRFASPREEGGREAATESATPGAPENLRELGPQVRVVPGQDHRPIIHPGPPAEPVPVLPPTPFPAGEGRERIPNHTGGDQVPRGLEEGLITEFSVHEPGGLIHITPDQSEELSQPLYLLNEEGTPIYDDIPISPRFIGKANQKHHSEDVWFDAKGYPIFDKYTIATVKIELTGSRDRDKRLASKKAISDKLLTEIPDNYVWHHHQDMTTMQLVLKSVHDAVGHTGGFSNHAKRKKARDKNQ